MTTLRRRIEVDTDAGSRDNVPVMQTTPAPRHRKSFSFQVLVVICCILAFTLGIVRHKHAGNVRQKHAGMVQSKSTTDSSKLFVSGVPAYDEAFTLALNEVQENTVNGEFIAGAGWTLLWTRDTSYAVELSAALINPQASKTSLESCTHVVARVGTTWLQDQCGHFGGWPHLTDASVGAQGAWALYLSTGDHEFLSWAFDITNRTLTWAEREVLSEVGLFKGCSSFMESNSGYPKKYSNNGHLVGKTKALSTNVLYYNGYKIAEKMAKELGASESVIQSFRERAAKLRDVIRSRLWMDDMGQYAYFEDENQQLVKTVEGLGQALLLLADELETDHTRVDQIFANAYRSSLGIPCLWPRFDLKPKGVFEYYHNGRVWPFVQGYWAIAAARHGKVDVFAEEFENLMKLSQMSNTFAEFYELDGSFLPSRRRQLWSSAGFVGMVYHGLFGLELLRDGIQFRPAKPATPFANTVSLWNIPYRQAKLTIHLSGSGSKVESFKLNGVLAERPFLPATSVGPQKIEIIVSESELTKQG